MKKNMKDYAENLRKTCPALKRETEGITDEKASLKPTPDKWCIKEIVWHLADIEEEVNTIRLRRILRETRPYLHVVDQDRLAQEREYMKRNLTDGIEKFCTQRASSIEIVESAKPEDWARMGSHQTRGVITFEDVVKTMIVHDEKHLGQIKKIKEGFL